MSRWEIGQQGDVTYAEIVLVGLYGEINAPLTTVHSGLELKLWIKSCKRTWIDPDRWRGVAHRFPDRTIFIPTEDWNRGERLEIYHEIPLPDLSKLLVPLEAFGKLVGRRFWTCTILGLLATAYIYVPD